MASTTYAERAARDQPGAARDWWLAALGILGLLVPTGIRFATTIWTTSEHSYGPFVLAIALYLFWRARPTNADAAAGGARIGGWLLLAGGLLVYLFGVWTKVAVLEAAAELPLFAGALWLVGGARSVRRAWFALLFLALFIPYPSYLLTSATADLKRLVSAIAESLLYAGGYPIARNGVVLTIGQYRLFVADACSGMNSIVSLTATGLFYIYLVRPARTWQVATLVAAILPIAIAANILRVMILVLVTYYLGDEAGQGFLHEFAGVAMFVLAVVALSVIDAVLARLGGRRGAAPAEAAAAATHG